MTHTKLPYPAPDFSLLDAEGASHSLANYRGSWLVLYFYPKDDTPGCTVEACAMRDAHSELTELGVKIVGVSADTSESHDTFKAKYDLNFTLLADPKLETIKAYGAKMLALPMAERKTFVIDPSGMVVKVYEHVTPEDHAAQLQRDIVELQKNAP